MMSLFQLIVVVGILCMNSSSIFVVAAAVVSGSDVKDNNNVQKQQQPRTITIYSTIPSTNHDLSAVARKQMYDWEQIKNNLENNNNIQFNIHYLTNIEQRKFIVSNIKDCGGQVIVDVYDALEVATQQQQQQHSSSSSSSSLQVELYKWCAFAATTSSSESNTINSDDDDTIIYIDSSTPIMNVKALQQRFIMNTKKNKKNVYVYDDTLSTVHGSYIQMTNTKENQLLALRMIQMITSTPMNVLRSVTLLIPNTVFKYITESNNSNDGSSSSSWYPLQLKCNNNNNKGSRNSSNNNSDSIVPRDPFTCTKGYCCMIQDNITTKDSNNKNKNGVTLFMSRHYVVPTQMIPQVVDGSTTASQKQQQQKQGLSLPYPLHYRTISDPIKQQQCDRDIPYISTIRVKQLQQQATPTKGKAASEDEDEDDDDNNNKTPNFYHILKKDNCLPDHDHCSKCLREKSGATCDGTCKEVCGCYCTKLCQTSIPPKKIVQEWTITPPIYQQYPQRLIPKIVHQTWFEYMNAESYPNMSRLMESFKQSGWEYRFYTDDDIIDFLQIHFPPEVLQAYDAIIPGAFKADLFRYCVLLIYGGVYADVDIQLQSVLDISIPYDVGFMVPIDEPGKPVQKQMCVWNGFIASAPSHPFLVKAIETIVNQVRNRYTSVDIDATFCPNPELSILHAYDTLFTAGPCMLGASMNRVLGRSPQTSHIPGEVHGIWSNEQRDLTISGTSFVVQQDSDNHNNIEQYRIPGRTIILHQNKWDMGAHRFTFLEQNIVIAATDLPDSNDRLMNIDKPPAEDGTTDVVEIDEDSKQQHEHYSKAHAKTGVYGVEHLYHNQYIANEDIRIVIDATLHTQKQLALSVSKINPMIMTS